MRWWKWLGVAGECWEEKGLRHCRLVFWCRCSGALVLWCMEEVRSNVAVRRAGSPNQISQLPAFDKSGEGPLAAQRPHAAWVQNLQQLVHPATSATMHCNVAATIQKVHQLHHSSNRYILPTFYLQRQNISISYSTHKFSHIFHSIEKFVDIHCFRKGG